MLAPILTITTALVASVAAAPIVGAREIHNAALVGVQRNTGAYGIYYEYFAVVATDDFIPGLPGFAVSCNHFHNAAYNEDATCIYAPDGVSVIVTWPNSLSEAVVTYTYDGQTASGTVSWDGGSDGSWPFTMST
ncbi:hypothetical protein GGR57DRAFT_139927 [Xylariaceae sp. FL1272]|nr:hypothetical protein GGR57DRAFT_139927 [Xylariaceae sp. FL1272]